MIVSAGYILDKISETRSKIAVIDGLMLHLRANYLPSDAGEPEMRFFRNDYAPVPASHIHEAIRDYETIRNKLMGEIIRLESVDVNVSIDEDGEAEENLSSEGVVVENDSEEPEEEIEEEPEEEPEPEPVRAKAKKKRISDQPSRVVS